MIRSRHNRTLKDIRRLGRSKGEHALLEGAKLVGEALAAGVPIEAVLATPELLASPPGRHLEAALPCAPLVVEAHLLEQIGDADSPRGLLALASLPRGGVTALPRRPGAVYLFLEGLQDPGNLGALARVAEAAGAAGMALAPGTAHPNHPRAQRAAAGSLLRLPVAVGADPAELDRHLAGAPASHPPTWAVLVPRDGADLFSAAPLPGIDGTAHGETLVLALGAEGPGVSAALAARAAVRLTIPMAAPVESLNVTVAAALALFELRRRRAAAAPAADAAALLA